MIKYVGPRRVLVGATLATALLGVISTTGHAAVSRSAYAAVSTSAYAAVSTSAYAAVSTSAHVAVPTSAYAAPWRLASGDTAPTREQILTELRVDQTPADYVVLVDTSGSMTAGNLYGGVQRTLRTFLAGLSPHDHVAVYTFDSRPTPRYVGRAGNPDRMLAGLPSRPNPSGATDIGAALERAVEELERPGAASVASVVLLTDGAHDPPRGSAYPDDSGPRWQALADRAARLKDRTLAGYALPLRGATGARLLGTVLPQTTELDPGSIDELGRYLDRAKVGTRLAKARQALAGDVGKGMTAAWTTPETADLSTGSGPVPVTLTLRSETARVPLTVSGLNARADEDATLIGELPDTVALAPGQSRSFSLALDWRPDVGAVPFRDEQRVAPHLVVDGAVTSPWSEPLDAVIDLETPNQVAAAPAQVTLTAVVGTWAAQVVTALVGVLAVVILGLFLYRRRRAPLAGTLLATAPSDGSELGRFPLRGRSARLSGQRLPGHAVVVARRVPSTFANPDGVEYAVTYHRAGHRSRSTCPSDGSVLVSGVSFTHVPPGGADARVRRANGSHAGAPEVPIV